MNPQWLEVDWPAPPGVRVLSTFRSAGVSAPPFASLNLGDHVGDDLNAVLANRRALERAAGLPAAPVWLAQVHGIGVANLDAADERPGTADAAFTRRPNVVCAILTADCLPIVVAEQSGAVVGVAHAGWRGLAAGVIEAAVHALSVPPASLLAWLGPGIGQAHFEVGAEVREALLQGDPGAAAAFEGSAAGRHRANLGLLARRRLQRLGIERIYGGGECTYARGDRYFSHRRDGLTGRQATLVWRET